MYSSGGCHDASERDYRNAVMRSPIKVLWVLGDGGVKAIDAACSQQPDKLCWALKSLGRNRCRARQYERRHSLVSLQQE